MKNHNKKIIREAQAGMIDKGDVLIRIKPAAIGAGVQMDHQSKVLSLFGDQIRTSVLDILNRYSTLNI